MGRRSMTESECSTLQSALFTAAAAYDKLAIAAIEDNPRITDQFIRQSKDARELRNLIEQCEDIRFQF